MQLGQVYFIGGAMKDKHATPPVVFVLEERIAELEKKLAKAVEFAILQKEIAFRRGDSLLYNDFKRLLKSLEEKEGE